MIDANVFLIVGGRTDEFKGPAVGVAFFPDPPDGKVCKRMGFVNLNTTERISVDSEGARSGSPTIPSEPTLFFFERRPGVSETFVAKLNPDGSISNVRKEELPPLHVIPRLSGSQVERFIPKSTGPDFSDATKLGKPNPGSQDSRTKLRR